MSRKKLPRKYGMRPINAKSKRGGRGFSLEEHLEDRVSAAVAQVEWWCEGYCCHIEPDDQNKVYYVWVGPKRKTTVHLLPGEKVKRQKFTHVSPVRSHRKIKAMA